jgi:UDP-N-acetylglucosamine:LPS N-acetylglucosamine transferase
MAMNAASHSRGKTPHRVRILVVASGGGHWVQILRLRPAFAGEHVAYATVNRAYQAEVGAAPFYVVKDATRWNKFRLFILAFQILYILLRERPDVVITSGAAPGYFAVLFARMLRKRTIWLDSMANVDQLSMSGTKASRWSDVWLTQWPQLAREGGPTYAGTVL